MLKYGKRLFKILKEAYKGFTQNDTFVMGAALSYYTVFSIAPIFIIIISIAGIVLGPEAARGEIYSQAQSFLGKEGALQLQEMVEKAYDPGKNWWGTVIAVGLLLFGATTVFTQLQQAMNKIWSVKPKPKRGYVKLIKDRILTFGFILTLGFILLVSLMLNAAINSLTVGILNQLGLPNSSKYLFQAIDFVLSIGIVTLLFSLLYKYLPDAIIRWRDVWPGALFTSILFALGRLGIGYYLGQSDVASTYGAAGSLVLILMWVNYSSQILFFGAEFTQAYARQYGQKIIPTQYAVRVKSVEVEQGDDEDVDEFEEKLSHTEEASGIPDEERSNTTPAWDEEESEQHTSQQASSLLRPIKKGEESSTHANDPSPLKRKRNLKDG